MRKKLTKILNSFGYILVNTKFGIYGDWMIVDRDGNERFFPTLGGVRLFVEELKI